MSLHRFLTRQPAFDLLAPLLALIPLAATAQFYGVDEPVMGVYEGSWTTENLEKSKLRCQLRALGDNRYDGFILLDRSQQTIAPLSVKSTASTAGSTVTLIGESAAPGAGGELLPKIQFQGQIVGRRLTGKLSGDLGNGQVEAERVARKPASLGAIPPPGAIVLFDGKDTSRWENFTWKTTDEGAMQVVKGDIRAKDKLDSFRLHIEFRTPFMPRARGQARGNSGVYLQRQFEVQVLDSFGLYPLKNNDCSSIYGVSTTLFNACLPPMEWQTYDITFVQGDPTRKAGPTITVIHNGVKVIDEARVPWEIVEKGTTSGDSSADGGFLKLQDHGNPVEYRNLWAIGL